MVVTPKVSSKVASLPFFSQLQPSSTEGQFALEKELNTDQDASKVNLIIGAYQDDAAKPWQLQSVTKTKRRLEIENVHHETQVFGADGVLQHGHPIASIQTVSGTGANSLAAIFLREHLRPAYVWLVSPTWANHPDIWNVNTPGVKVRYYPYYDTTTKAFDFEGMVNTLSLHARSHDVILLHACAHNPTGIDPSKDQWRMLACFCREKKLFVLFDLAYQGFASGDPDEDAWAVRYFASDPSTEMADCQSFSKNMGLYGECAGALHVLVSREASSVDVMAVAVQDALVDVQRALISMAPAEGSLVVSRVLCDEDLHLLWREDLVAMCQRIKAMCQALYSELVRLGTPGSWEHIVQQKGMFSYTGLNALQVERLKMEYHVYLLPSGRASICGLTSENVVPRCLGRATAAWTFSQVNVIEALLLQKKL